MLVERASHPQFLSNTYLVADGEGGPAFFIDAGGPVAPLIDAAERLGLTPTHVLLTHHHFDHVSDVGELLRALAQAEGADQPSASASCSTAPPPGPRPGPATAGMGSIEAGQILRFGALEVRPLHTPGHAAGMLSFLVGERRRGGCPRARRQERRARRARRRRAGVFTGDTLFKDSVGGVRAPGHTTYTDLRDSIMGTLMELPPDTVIYPGHAEQSTVAREWDANAFIRVWRGLDPQGTQSCTALGQPATLVLLGADYDGGTKAWVRWQDGSDDIVPGSRIDGR